jgi:hypothetical protein
MGMASHPLIVQHACEIAFKKARRSREGSSIIQVHKNMYKGESEHESVSHDLKCQIHTK